MILRNVFWTLLDALLLQVATFIHVHAVRMHGTLAK